MEEPAAGPVLAIKSCDKAHAEVAVTHWLKKRGWLKSDEPCTDCRSENDGQSSECCLEWFEGGALVMEPSFEKPEEESEKEPELLIKFTLKAEEGLDKDLVTWVREAPFESGEKRKEFYDLLEGKEVYKLKQLASLQDDELETAKVHEKVRKRVQDTGLSPESASKAAEEQRARQQVARDTVNAELARTQQFIESALEASREVVSQGSANLREQVAADLSRASEALAELQVSEANLAVESSRLDALASSSGGFVNGQRLSIVELINYAQVMHGIRRAKVPLRLEGLGLRRSSSSNSRP